jgi:post-segregation antitoxin (ccd killing protein)
MRDPFLFDPKAAKQTVSVTLNSDLYAKAKSLGINASRVAEEALAAEYAAQRGAALRAELERDLAALEAYSAEHGSFADLARAEYERDDGAV